MALRPQLSMHNHVREYLIDKAHAGKSDFYQDLADACSLGLNMNLELHRAEIGKVQGDISAYEHRVSRPLISAVAILGQSGEHGDGFYRLCELLGVGTTKALKRDDYGIHQLKESFDL